MSNQLTSEAGSWTVETWLHDSAVVASPSRPSKPAEPEGAGLQAEVIVRTISQMLCCGDPEKASRLLANRLQQLLGCRQVAIGICTRQQGRCRIQGLSGAVRFDSHSRFTAAIQDALEETVAHESETLWPPCAQPEQHGALAHEKLVAMLGAECVVSLPLRDVEERIVGVVLFVDELAESARDLVSRYGTAMASCIGALQRERTSSLLRLVRRFQNRLASSRGRAICAAAVCLTVLLAMPWSHKVSCSCKVQPVTRRFVVAPYDGTLESSLVSPGDVVKTGDVLARMDEREINWELAGLKADLARANKERDAAMAAHRAGGAQLAELEKERLRVQIKLLEHRIDHLAIRSPIDGIVVTGDLEKAEGAPLTIGQTLFEVAPLEEMTVEVSVPEQDIAFVNQGMEVAVRLDAFPNEATSGTLDRIHPQAELRDHQSVFVAEFRKGNPDGNLRPGMQGWAEITGRKRSLAWILFHKPWNRLQRTLVW